MELLDRIKYLASERNITIAELERKIGISNGQIRKWAKQTPGVDKLKLVADYFNVSTDYLLGRTDNPTTKTESNSYLRVDRDGLNEDEFDEYIDDVEAYMELRKKMLLEKRKK